MTKADLHRKYADALDLCEKYKLNWRNAVQVNGGYLSTPPDFANPNYTHTFPIAVIEGKPVFVDTLYTKHGSHFKIEDNQSYNSESLAENLTWNPPKPKTFTLNGVEFEVPTKQRTPGSQYYTLSFFGVNYFFKDSCEANDFITLLQILLNGDQDKL